MFRTRISHADLMVSVCVALLAILILLFPLLMSDRGIRLVVSSASGSESYLLSDNREITVVSNGHTVKVEILDGKARVIESDCPDGVCVSSGWIEQSGQTVICAPAGVRLLIESGKGGDGNVDFVAG